jgi:Aldo/keto reductase family
LEATRALCKQGVAGSIPATSTNFFSNCKALVRSISAPIPLFSFLLCTNCARMAYWTVIDLLGSIGKRKNATAAQIALAWLLAQKPWIVPIPGATKLTRLEENIGAVAVELTAYDLRDIDAAASKIKVEGARYPEKLEKMTGL